MEAPYVLIGLGGIGSQVVNEIYSMIPLQDRVNVAVHAFDTDVNWIQNMTHLKDEDRITQVSEPITVKRCLLYMPQSVKNWFPDDNRELLRKTMTEGAAMIRSVSRLAYYRAMQIGRLVKFEQQVGSIFTASGYATGQSVRVAIVSSLAGGTGAGLFLQTAFYVRELLNRTFQKDATIVRGFFLLPDILIKSGAMPKSKWENIRANAYACMKELDAFTRNASSGGEEQTGVNLELEYRPKQVDEHQRQSHVITPDQLPYDFCFLFDFENSRGENLGQVDSYIDQATKAVFLQLFSPLEDKHFSEEDNFILKLIEQEGTNRYCGAGCASLIYPYEDLVEYCSLRWAEELLSEQWLQLDEDFHRELETFREDQRQGIFREAPMKGKKYVELLDSYANGESPHPFFSPLFRSTRLFNEKGSEIGRKSDLFLQAIEEQIKNTIYNDNELQELIGQCRTKPEILRKKEHAKRHIRDIEENLERLRKLVYRKINDLKTFLVNQIVGEDCRHPNCLGGDEDYRLNVWFMNRKKPLHPVTVRYLLYQINDLIDQRLGELFGTNKTIKTTIETYYKRYDLHETRDREETWEERLRLGLDQPIYSRIFKSDFTKFIKEYDLGSKKQLELLNRYSSERLLEEVLLGTQRAIASLIDTWEGYFLCLRDKVQIGLLESISMLERRHEGVASPSKRYVMASREAKQKTWERMKDDLATASDLPSDTCREIYIGIYRRFCEAIRHADSIEQEPYEETFQKTMLSWCRDKIRENNESLDIDVVTAIKREGSKLGEVIRTLDMLAQPFAPADRPDNMLVYWAMNEECEKNINESEANELFGEKTRRIINPAFSKYEILRYRAIYGLKAEDFPKFKNMDMSGKPGDYFTAYRKRIQQLVSKGQKTISPHLDKRWHLPAYMPDLNDDLALVDQRNSDRAFLLGLIYNLLMRVTVDSVNVWDHYSKGKPLEAVKVGGKNIQQNFYDLWQAMPHNPSIVDSIIGEAMEKLKDRKEIKTHDDHQFTNGCKDVGGENINIFDVIFSLQKERYDLNLQSQIGRLLDLCLEEIQQFFVAFLGRHQINTANEACGEFLNTLINESHLFQESKTENNETYLEWQRRIDEFNQKLKAK